MDIESSKFENSNHYFLGDSLKNYIQGVSAATSGGISLGFFCLSKVCLLRVRDILLDLMHFLGKFKVEFFKVIIKLGKDAIFGKNTKYAKDARDQNKLVASNKNISNFR